MIKQFFKKLLVVSSCKLNLILKFIYCFSYDTGLFTLNFFLAIFIGAGKFAKSVLHMFKIIFKSAHKKLALFINVIVSAGKCLVKLIKVSYCDFKRNGLNSALTLFAVNIKMVLHKNKKKIIHALNYLAPAAATIALLITVSVWSNVTFALQVKHSGNTLGYISNESVFNQAAQIVKKRVVGDSSKITSDTQYSVTVVSSDNLTSADSLSDKLISASGDAVNAYGLYVNNKFVAATITKEDIDYTLNEIKTEEESKNSYGSADFQADIKIVPGLYTIDHICTPQELKGLLTDSILPVKGVVTRTVTQTIPYNTIEIQDNTIAKGVTTVKNEGVDGQQQVTMEIMMENGKAVSSKSVSTKIIKPAVDKQIIVGTRPVDVVVNPGAVFSWPVEKTADQYISSYFGDGRNHPGIDIATHIGTEILAAAAGKVTGINSAGEGYGLNILIDHGNGYQTLYAHCSEIDVTLGQSVLAGQMIGKTGSTGFSTGPHLHFEIHYNNLVIDPAPLLGLKEN